MKPVSSICYSIPNLICILTWVGFVFQAGSKRPFMGKKWRSYLWQGIFKLNQNLCFSLKSGSNSPGEWNLLPSVLLILLLDNFSSSFKNVLKNIFKNCDEKKIPWQKQLQKEKSMLVPSSKLLQSITLGESQQGCEAVSGIPRKQRIKEAHGHLLSSYTVQDREWCHPQWAALSPSVNPMKII